MKIIKWEYCLKYMDRKSYSVQEITEKFNSLGKEGWEFVGMIIPDTKSYLIFKRPCGYLD